MFLYLFSLSVSRNSHCVFFHSFSFVHTVKALLIRYIVDKQDAHCAAIVGSGDGPEAFLACGVPYLQFHALAV